MSKKINEVVNDAYMKELMDIPPVEVNEERVCSQVFNKLGIEKQAAKSNIIDFSSAKKPKRVTGKFLRIAAAAAIVLSIGATAVAAATIIYNQMAPQKIEYFSPVSDNSKLPVAHDINEPGYHTGLKADLESLNTVVGETIDTGKGVKVTLDTVAVDSSFINAFFTLEYDEAIDLAKFSESDLPEYTKLDVFMPWFGISIDGDELPSSWTEDQNDPYLENENTIKYMMRVPVTTALPDQFECGFNLYSMTLPDGSRIARENVAPKVDESGKVIKNETTELNFSVPVGISATKALTKNAEAKTYELNGKSLELEKLSVSPFGSSFVLRDRDNELSMELAQSHTEEEIAQMDLAKMSAELDAKYISELYPFNFYITDSLNNVVNVINRNELIGIDPNAESITITPVKRTNSRSDATETSYSVTDIGAKMPTNELGGFYLKNFAVNGQRVSVTLSPYGSVDYGTEVFFNDDKIASAQTNHSGLINHQIDRNTGDVIFSVDYYSATAEELATIDSFTVHSDSEVTLDEASAITIPLK